MADNISGASDQDSSSSAAQVPLEKIHALLESKDDTSRFVGLALLKSVLEDEAVTSSPDTVGSLWKSLSPKFLDRLLRSRAGDKVSQKEAEDLVDLAVAVLHAFTLLLPVETQKSSRLTKRIGPLTNAVIHRYVGRCHR